MWNLVTFPQDSRPKNWIYRPQSCDILIIVAASWDHSYPFAYCDKSGIPIRHETASKEHRPVELSDLEPTAQKSWRLKKTFPVTIFCAGWVCQGRESCEVLCRRTMPYHRHTMKHGDLAGLDWFWLNMDPLTLESGCFLWNKRPVSWDVLNVKRKGTGYHQGSIIFDQNKRYSRQFSRSRRTEGCRYLHTYHCSSCRTLMDGGSKRACLACDSVPRPVWAQRFQRDDETHISTFGDTACKDVMRWCQYTVLILLFP